MANTIVKKLGQSLGLGAGLLVLGGLGCLIVLPKSVHIERSAFVAASPSAVYTQLVSSQGFHSINPFVQMHPDLKITMTGPAQGIAATYAWSGSAGTGSQTIVQLEPDAKVVMQLDMGFRGKPVQTFLIKPSAIGSTVTWVQDADLGYNPIARMIGLTLDNKLGPVYERGLARLNQVLAGKSN
jgi:hypothetical protein